MKKFNERLGTDYSVGQFVEKIFEKGKINAERRAWLDVNRETMNDVALFIGKNVKAASPRTEVGLMSSAAVSHALEARDWKTLTENLAQGKRIINRIHLPAYNENVPAYYYRYFNMTSTFVRKFLPDDANIYPEIESGDYNNFVKDAKFLQFQIESASPLLLSGTTYNILDVVGNGAFDRAGYGKAIKEITPYMKAITALGLKYSSLEGVVVPFDPDCAYKRSINANYRDLYAYDAEFAGYACGLGVPYKISLDKNIKGEFVCLICESTEDYTDDELVFLFKNNFVLVDGGAAKNIVERGLGDLIGADFAEVIPTNKGLTAYERTELTIDGKTGLKASTEGGINSSGDYVKIIYDDKAELRVLSRI